MRMDELYRARTDCVGFKWGCSIELASGGALREMWGIPALQSDRARSLDMGFSRQITPLMNREVGPRLIGRTA